MPEQNTVISITCTTTWRKYPMKTSMKWRKQYVWTQSRFVVRDEEGKFVVHSDWTKSFCYYTFFGSFRCTFIWLSQSFPNLGKDCCCQKFTITRSLHLTLSSAGAHACVFYFIIIPLRKSFSSPEAALLLVSTKNRDILVLTKRSAASGDENA